MHRRFPYILEDRTIGISCAPQNGEKNLASVKEGGERVCKPVLDPVGFESRRWQNSRGHLL